MDSKHLEFIKDYSKKIDPDKTIEDVLIHLVDRKVIRPNKLRNALIIKRFDYFFKEYNGAELMNVYLDLSIEFDIAPYTIRDIVSNRRLNDF